MGKRYPAIGSDLAPVSISGQTDITRAGDEVDHRLHGVVRQRRLARLTRLFAQQPIWESSV
jgi:hypothetical protein